MGVTYRVSGAPTEARELIVRWGPRVMKLRVKRGSAEEAEDLFKRSADRLLQMSDRLQLGIVAGTTGAFVIVAGQVVSGLGKPEVVSLLLPSCWILAVSMGSAIFAPLLAWIHQLSHYSVMKRVTTEADFRPRKWMMAIMENGWWCQVMAQGVSLVLLAAGILTPLMKVSEGYRLSF